MKHYLWLLIITINVWLITPATEAAELKKASFRPQWVPQAQFAGYYVALIKGFYKEAGIDLEIRPGGPGISTLNNIASGKDTFGTEWLMSGIVVASKGAPIVNIAQMFQTSGLMLVSSKKSGITDPKQMDGRTVGVWPSLFSIPPTLLFKKFKIQPKLVSQRFSIDEFIAGQLDVASAMTYNEYPLMLESGLKSSELNTFYFKDYGMNFPEDGIYVHRDTLQRDPELCRNFVKASIKGWKYAFEHPEEAVSIVMDAATQAKTGTRREHQVTMLEESMKLTLFRVGLEKIGELDPEAFAFVYNALKETEHVQKPLKYEEFHQPLYE